MFEDNVPLWEADVLQCLSVPSDSNAFYYACKSEKKLIRSPLIEVVEATIVKSFSGATFCKELRRVLQNRFPINLVIFIQGL